MTKKSKLLKRFQEAPKDLTWAELTKLLNTLGYEEYNSGKTSGSRVRFISNNHNDIMLHKPHPKPILKRYQIKQVLDHLMNEGLI